MSEKPYLFIGGPWHEQWKVQRPNDYKIVVPEQRGQMGWDIYYPGASQLKSVDIHWDHKTYSRVPYALGRGVTVEIYKWDDWDDEDVSAAFGTYMKFLLACEAGIDTSDT